MKKIFLLALTGLTGLEAGAQTRKDTLKLYFAINEVQNELNTKKIDSLSSALASRVYNVWIYGYADFLHTGGYNLALSRKRAGWVREILLKKSSEPQMTIMACEGKGEAFSSDNGSLDGDFRNRRVDLIYEVRGAGRVVDTRPIKLSEKKDTSAAQNQSTEPKTIETLGKGESMELEGLTFVPGRHVVRFESIPVLKKLLQTMQENPELKIEIQGHVCCSPGPEDGYDPDAGDYRLSRNRAREVYNYLVKNGIDPERMKYRGFGHSRPKVEETSPETMQINRRVEIMVLEK